MIKNILQFVFLIMFTSTVAADPIKIMPVGNSITAGEHYGEPANRERTGYRKDLYWMLIKAGYDVDFVGSQKHGERSENEQDWYDWNSEAYPGWTITSISNKLRDALPVYKPDILLVHVGTNGNNWSLKPAQVMNMLDMINNFAVKNNHPMTVFLCKIINRFKGGHDETTRFNKDVADSVAARVGDNIKIIMIDMENGAGLDYTDNPPDSSINPPYEGGDMWGTKYPGVSIDLYHPNDKGNTKMALKFYEELVKEFGVPESGANSDLNQLPNILNLYQNYSNPIHPETSIRYTISDGTGGQFNLYNIIMQSIYAVIIEYKNMRAYTLSFNLTNLMCGDFCERESNGNSTNKRLQFFNNKIS